jgi:hypothetical protein
MRIRKQLITNLYVKDKDIKRLANGYVVYKRANKHAHAIIPKQRRDDTKKAEVLKAKIAYHQQKLEKLIGTLPANGVKYINVKLPNGTTYTKRAKYTKKNLEYWNKLKDPKVMQARVKKGKINETPNNV